MVDKNQLKTQGLAFGRNLQRAYKIVLLYSPDHAGAQDALQQAYAKLTELLKLSPQFTFGFFNQRVRRTSPEALLLFGQQRRDEVFGRKILDQEIAVELAEDMAVEWAGKRLLEAGSGSGEGTGTGAGPETGTGTGSGTGEGTGSGTGGAFGGGKGKTTGSASEKEVARVLSRTLKTTQMAHRLLQKVGALAKQAQLPPEMVGRIQEELQWSALTNEERHARLLEMDEFDEGKFRRLLDHVAEMGREGNVEEATQASERFLAWLDSTSGEDRVAGLSWLPELLQALTGLHTLSFVRMVIERLCPQLAEDPVSDWPRHRALVNSLASAAQCAALFEGFDASLKVGLELERFGERDAARHADCCRAGLNSLLAPRSVERLVELAAPEAGRHVLGADTGRVGAPDSGTDCGSRFPSPGRRNGCDESLAADPAGRATGQERPGGGAQEACRPAVVRLCATRAIFWALWAIRSWLLICARRCVIPMSASRKPPWQRSRRARLSAGKKRWGKPSPYLQPHAQEAVLNELLLARNPATISLLEDFVCLATGSKQGMREKAVQVLATIPETRGVEALGRILDDSMLALTLRRTALNALRGSAFPVARELLAEFARTTPADPLAGECRAAAAPKTP